jgi:DNA-binding transcriptional ArsR family regulator
MDRDEEHDLEETAGTPVGERARQPVVGGGSVPIDDVLEAASDATRRAVLRELRDREVATVDELAAAVAARSLDADGGATEAARKRTSIELAHVHLPELADYGFVEFDRRTSTARYADPPRDLEAVLRLVEELQEAREG